MDVLSVRVDGSIIDRFSHASALQRSKCLLQLLNTSDYDTRELIPRFEVVVRLLPVPNGRHYAREESINYFCGVTAGSLSRGFLP